jgi:hypothetical protein
MELDIVASFGGNHIKLEKRKEVFWSKLVTK